MSRPLLVAAAMPVVVGVLTGCDGLARLSDGTLAIHGTVLGRSGQRSFDALAVRATIDVGDPPCATGHIVLEVDGDVLDSESLREAGAPGGGSGCVGDSLEGFVDDEDRAESRTVEVVVTDGIHQMRTAIDGVVGPYALGDLQMPIERASTVRVGFVGATSAMTGVVTFTRDDQDIEIEAIFEDGTVVIPTEQLAAGGSWDWTVKASSTLTPSTCEGVRACSAALSIDWQGFPPFVLE